MERLFFIFSFLFGLIIGSFLNTVIYRYNTGRTLGGRSHCFACGRALGWRELVPLLSYLTQAGRCLKCRSRISWQYPLVELATGALFYLAATRVGLPAETRALIHLLVYWFIFSLLTVIVVYDLRHKIIPDALVYTFVAIGLFLAVYDRALGRLPAGLYFFAFFALIWLVSRGRWMGFGDAKLALGLGFFLGLAPGLSALFLAFWSGAALGLAIIAVNRLRRRGRSFTIKSELPFAPFMILGLALVFFFHINVINWSF